MPECGQHLRSLRRGRLCRNELDRALDRGEEGVAVAAREQVEAEALVQERRPQRVVLADNRDRSARELHRARGSARLRRPPRPSRHELRKVDPHELGRLGYGVPQRERAFEVREGLGQPEDCLCLPTRFDRSDERLCRATGRRPVGCELRRRRGSAAS